jgi:hypothetical protein
MKLVAGAILLLAAEQAYAQAHLIQFPNHDIASGVLIPAALVLAVLGGLVFAWGLWTETGGCAAGKCGRSSGDKA